MTLRYATRVLFRKLWILLLIPLLAFAAAVYFTKDLKNTYVSTAQLTTGEKAVNEPAVRFNNLIQILTSPRVVGLTSYSLIISELDSGARFKMLPDSALRSPIYVQIIEEKDKARRVLQNHLDSMQQLTAAIPYERKLLEFMRLYSLDYESVTKNKIEAYRIENTDFINVRARTENAQFSAFMVNALCHQFLRVAGIRRAESQSPLATLKAIAEEKKKESQQKATRLRDYKVSHGVVNPEREGKSKTDLIKEFTASLATAQNSLYAAQLEMSTVDRRLQTIANTPDPKVLQSQANSQILRLRDEIKELRQKLDQKEDEKTRKRISDLRNQLADVESRASVSEDTPAPSDQKEELESAKTTLDVKIESLEQSIEDYESKLEQLQNAYGSYASEEAIVTSLQKEADLAQKEYSLAEEKYNRTVETNLVLGSEIIRQTLFGQPAVRPEPNARPRVIALSLGGSFVLAFLLIVVIESLDTSLLKPGRFTSRVGLPLIGMVTRLPYPDKDLLHILNDREARRPKENTFRDLVKKARYSIEKAGDKIVLLTSTKSGEGKSTLIIALATVLAAGRKKVLVIDTNFMNNTITRYFQSKPVLEDLGAISNILEDDFLAAISTTPVQNLDVIGCQGGLYSPSDLLVGMSFLPRLSRLSSSYDYVFMEGASLNKYSDSKELAEYAQGVIVVFSASSTIYPADKDSIAFLTSLDGKFRGAILNNVPAGNIDL